MAKSDKIWAFPSPFLSFSLQCDDQNSYRYNEKNSTQLLDELMATAKDTVWE